MIDLTAARCASRPPPGANATWRGCKRSLLKLRGERSVEQVDGEFARLRAAYDQHWDRGY